MNFDRKAAFKIVKILADAFLRKNASKTLDFEGKRSDNCKDKRKQEVKNGKQDC